MKLFIFLCLQYLITADICPSDNCTNFGQNVLEIHFLNHAHLDPFWRQTFQEYLDGTGKDSQDHWISVRNQFNRLLEALEKNNSRTYSISEISYLKTFYEQISENEQIKFKKLIEAGQIEFLNGGWVQNDEALPFYDDIIDQLFIGHYFLKKNFNVIPTIAYNAHNYGYSLAQASIHSQFGFNYYIIEKINQDQLLERKKNNTLLTILQPQISTGVFKDRIATLIVQLPHNTQAWHSEAILSYDCEKIENLFQNFETRIQDQSKDYNSTELLHYTGNIFCYYGEYKFIALDLLLNYYNSHKCKGYDIKYSTAEKYFSKQKHFNSTTETDIFPYEENGFYYTGYYTTSPDYKYFFREASRFIQKYRKLIAIGIGHNLIDDQQLLKINANMMKFQEEISLSQHHQGISCTSKYSALDDVVDRITNAWQNVSIDEIQLIKSITNNSNEFEQCAYNLNEDQCHILMLSHDSLIFAVFNPQKTIKKLIEIPLPENTFFIVKFKDSIQPGEIICHENRCRILFLTTLPGFQITQFILEKRKLQDENYVITNSQIIDSPTLPPTFVVKSQENFPEKIFKINNDYHSFDLTIKDGSRIESYNLKLSFCYFTGIKKKYWSQSEYRDNIVEGGKYIMLNDNEKKNFLKPKQIQFANSKYLIEVQILWTGVAMTTLKIQKFAKTAAIDIQTAWIGKDLPDNQRDYMLSIECNSIKQQSFYVDSNGLFAIERKQSKNLTIAENIQPMTSFSYIEDQCIIL